MGTVRLCFTWAAERTGGVMGESVNHLEADLSMGCIGFLGGSGQARGLRLSRSRRAASRHDGVERPAG